MDEETARFILNLFWWADGGDCAFCTGEMTRFFIEKFPQFEWIADEIAKKKGFDPMCWREH